MTSQLISERAFQDWQLMILFWSLADIVGGSPLTTAATVLEEAGKLDGALILGGMNLTMAWRQCDEGCVGGRRICQPPSLSEARSALQPFEISAAGAEEDDDDI